MIFNTIFYTIRVLFIHKCARARGKVQHGFIYVSDDYYCTFSLSFFLSIRIISFLPCSFLLYFSLVFLFSFFTFHVSVRFEMEACALVQLCIFHIVYFPCAHFSEFIIWLEANIWWGKYTIVIWMGENLVELPNRYHFSMCSGWMVINVIYIDIYIYLQLQQQIFCGRISSGID